MRWPGVDTGPDGGSESAEDEAPASLDLAVPRIGTADVVRRLEQAIAARGIPDDAPTEGGAIHADPPAPPPAVAPEPSEGGPMGLDQQIAALLAVDGATGTAIVDAHSGMALAQGGAPGFDLATAAAETSNVVRANGRALAALGLTDAVDDMLITLGAQYHLIKMLSGPDADGLFVYLVLDRTEANLALARRKLAAIARTIEI